MTKKYGKMMQSALNEALKKHEEELLGLKEYSNGFLKLAEFCIKSYDFIEKKFNITSAILNDFGETIGHPDRYILIEYAGEPDYQGIELIYAKEKLSNNLPDALRNKEKVQMISKFLSKNDCELEVDFLNVKDNEIGIEFKFDKSILNLSVTKKMQDDVFQKVLSLNNKKTDNK